MILKLRRTPPLLMAVYAVATCVFVLLGLERLFHDPVVEVDERGLVTRRGRRLAWTGLRQAEVKAEFRRRSPPSSMPVFWRVELKFEGAMLAFSPLLYENGLARHEQSGLDRAAQLGQTAGWCEAALSAVA